MLKLKNKQIAFIVGAVLIGGAVYLSNNLWRAEAATKEVKQMTQKMVTYCVGRYLIDLPQDTEVNYGATRIDGVDIAFLEMDLKQPPFSERLKAREEELKGEKNRAGQPSLERAEDVSHAQLKGRMFHYGRIGTPLIKQGKEVVVESHAAQAWLHAPGLEYRLEAELITPEWVGNISRLVQQLRPLPAIYIPTPNEIRLPAPTNEIPTEPGFCFERGIILDPPAPGQHESIVIHFRMKKYPDVVGNLSIGGNGGEKLPETLLERDAKSEVGKRYASHFTPIFKGERNINGIPGQEASEKVRENNGTSAHSFMWTAVGKLNDVFAPGMTLDIETGYGPPGKPLNSNLPDKAAIELWKQISSSLRPRPTTPGKSSDANNNPNDGNSPAVPKRLPLKSKVTSAVNCPQTGIWECAADAPGITQHRLYRQLGEPMPRGLAQAPKPSLAGFFGMKEDQPVDLTWTLVAYAKEKV